MCVDQNECTKADDLYTYGGVNSSNFDEVHPGPRSSCAHPVQPPADHIAALLPKNA